MFKKLFQKSKVPLKNQVQLCLSNRFYDYDEVNELLFREDIEIEEVGCNSQCEICDFHFYAIVNGEVVSADSAVELLQQIDEELTLNSIQ